MEVPSARHPHDYTHEQEEQEEKEEEEEKEEKEEKAAQEEDDVEEENGDEEVVEGEVEEKAPPHVPFVSTTANTTTTTSTTFTSRTTDSTYTKTTTPDISWRSGGLLTVGGLEFSPQTPDVASFVPCFTPADHHWDWLIPPPRGGRGEAAGRGAPLLSAESVPQDEVGVLRWMLQKAKLRSTIILISIISS